MKGSYLDSTVNALTKTGEMAFQDADFITYAGVGFTGYLFPGVFDTTVDPQFAGVFYYDKDIDCRKAYSTTTIQFQFLIETTNPSEMVAAVNTAMDRKVDSLLSTQSPFTDFQNDNALQKSAPTATILSEYTGKNATHEFSCFTEFFISPN
jgi:hypothetical protein